MDSGPIAVLEKTELGGVVEFSVLELSRRIEAFAGRNYSKEVTRYEESVPSTPLGAQHLAFIKCIEACID